MIYIVYHNNDFDGYFSAIITASELARKNNKAEFRFVGYNYEKELKINDDVFEPEWLTKEDEVFFVDVFNRDWEWFTKATEIMGHQPVIIDHHETTFNFLKEKGVNLNSKFDKPVFYKNDEYKHFVLSSSWKGENGETLLFSAAALCWYYFNVKDEKLLNEILNVGYVKPRIFYVPKFVELVARYDVWDKTFNTQWKQYILPFQFGLRSDERINTRNVVNSKFTKLYYLFRKGLDEEITLSDENGYNPDFKKYTEVEKRILGDYWKTVLSGNSILSYIAQRNKRIANQGKKCILAIEGINGDVFESDNCFFVCDYMNNSMVFEDGVKEYEKYNYLICLGPTLDAGSTNNDKVLCNIQIINANEKSNSSYLAQMLGGGGHKAIAGCRARVWVGKEKDGDEEKYILHLTPVEV